MTNDLIVHPNQSSDQNESSNRQLTLWNDSPPQLSERIRRETHEGIEFFSLVDLMGEFTDLDTRPDVLWKRTRERLIADGFQPDQKLIKLKLRSTKDGKRYKTECADAQTCLRIVQSIPSERAEPIRLWFASLGYQAMQGKPPKPQIPVRQSKSFRKHLDANYTPALAEQAIEIRDTTKDSLKAISSEWAQRGAQGADYGRLNNDVTEAATGHAVQWWRQRMGIKGSPREYFSAEKNAALNIVQQLATGLHKRRNSNGINDLEKDIFDAGGVIDHEKLRRLVPDLDLDTPSVPPEQKQLTSGDE